MKPSEVKVGDLAVSYESNPYIKNGEKFQIIALTKTDFVFVDNDGEIISRELYDTEWSFEPNPSRLNTQSIIIEVPTKVIVTFEKTEIERGEEYLIKTFELADLPQLKKEIEYQVQNLANPVSDIVNVKWEK